MNKQKFIELTGLDIDIISTVDHPFVSPPLRMFNTHKKLYELNKETKQKICILNWDISYPLERTYRYDLQIDLCFISKNKNYYLFEEEKEYCLQRPNKFNLEKYFIYFENVLQNLKQNNIFNNELFNILKSNCKLLKEEILSKLFKNDILIHHWTKQIYILINNFLKNRELANFIDENYLFYYNSKIVTNWIPYCIINATEKNEILNLLQISTRKLFRSKTLKIDDTTLNDYDFIKKNKKKIANLISKGLILPNVEVFFWSMQIAGIKHFGNDYGFFDKLTSFLGLENKTQLTTNNNDGIYPLMLKKDYAPVFTSNKCFFPNKKNIIKGSRINSIFSLFILLGKDIKEYLYGEETKIVTIKDNIITIE
ncbi:MAG: hypothetical protein LBU40_06135 [Methanobrevibacter sp.]|jgi:hypothetical protein|nr:hypothetical protein [Methanobrevibacter sp.]